MKLKFSAILFGILALSGGCINSFEKRFDCPLKEVTAETSQHFNILFIGTNLTVENNIPRMVSKLAKSMGDSLFYLTTAHYDYDFERHFSDNETKAMIRDFEWDYVVMQESGWRIALPPLMADTMSIRWADSLKHYIKEKHPQTQLIFFMTNGFANGVKAVDANWAKSDPDVATYKGMQERIKQNSMSLASRLDITIAPCGMLWRICLDKDSTLTLFSSDKINPTIEGSYLSACTLYSSIYRKRPGSAYYPKEISYKEASFYQDAVSEALFECNPDWRDY
jgi:hypothetical protein